jgi:dTDP-4-dehydrorhamnose 3,5-epimerase
MNPVSLRLLPTSLPGCHEIRFSPHLDPRGSFVKTFHRSTFQTLGLESDFQEIFYTVSQAHVLRGMHFQVPPADHAKLIYCISGCVMDVALDIRRGSPTFGRHWTTDLSPEKENGVYLPRGIAHGFYVREAPAVMVYHHTTEHVAALDSGIHWDSFGASWPCSAPMISTRDAVLPRFTEFDSPFVFAAHHSEPRERGHIA